MAHLEVTVHFVHKPQRFAVSQELDGYPQHQVDNDSERAAPEAFKLHFWPVSSKLEGLAVASKALQPFCPPRIQASRKVALKAFVETARAASKFAFA